MKNTIAQVLADYPEARNIEELAKVVMSTDALRTVADEAHQLEQVSIPKCDFLVLMEAANVWSFGYTMRSKLDMQLPGEKEHEWLHLATVIAVLRNAPHAKALTTLDAMKRG